MQMNPSNVAQLIVPQTEPLERRDHVQGPDRDVEFLSLRLLNKRGRVRLSPLAIDYSRLPGKSSLFAVGNKRGWFAAAIRKEDNGHYILTSTLNNLRTAFESGKADQESFLPFNPRRSPFNVPGTPTILKFALNDERLIIGFLEGPILVYNTNELFVSSQGSQPNPILSFPGDTSTIPRDILPNPGDSPELVAIMRGVHGQDPGHQIDVMDVQALTHVAGWKKGSDPNVAPVSISWSPKGKQIAIGLQSGDILLYSPLSTGSPKSHLFKPRSTPAETSSLLSTTWLSNPTFHTVFSSPEASSVLFDPSISDPPTHTHFISMHDSKSRSAVDVELRDPCPPFGAKRPPGPLSVVLRNWNPTKFIIFCGGGPSSDIGVIGTLPSDDPSKPGDQWASFNLEETSTPSLPLDEELNDLALLGLEVDLTSSTPIHMSEQPDDGTPDLPPSPILYAYTNDGTLVAWHILNSNGEIYPGMNAVGTADVAPATQAITQHDDGTETVGMSSPRVSPPASQEPVSMFDQTTATSAPPSSAFGQPSTSPSSTAFAPAQGFGAFSNAAASKFGSTGFGFGGGSAQSKLGQPPTAPAFGSMSFGGGSDDQGDGPKPASSTAFGTTGFGGAGKTTQQTPAPSPAFGTSGFGQASAASAFGVSAFASKPAAPAFGQSGFGTTSGISKPASAFGSTSGGFASFATQGSSTFGAPVKSPATSKPKSPSPPAFGHGSFGQTNSPFTSQSAFGAGSQGPASPPASAFGSGGLGQASKVTTPLPTVFGQQATQPTSAFGNFGQAGTTSAFGKPSFGSSTTLTPQGTSAFRGLGAMGDALKPSLPPAGLDSPPGSPPSPASSLSDSPELRPASLPEKPTSSYLKPAEGFGSFNKPLQGFGSFGGAAMPSSSSYIKPAEGFGSASFPKPSATTFGQQKSTPSSANPASPAFGSTSILGQTKPVFGTSSFGHTPQPTVVEPSKPITGGFGAFSSGGGGFASFANAGKSSPFEDILSSSEPDKRKSDTAPLAFGGTSSSKLPDAPKFGILNERKISPTLAEQSVDVSSTRTVGEGSDGSNEDEEGGKESVSEDKVTDQEPLLPPTKGEDPSFSLLSLGEETSQIAMSSATRSDTSSKKTEAGNAAEEMGKTNNGLEGGDDAASESFSLTDDSLDESSSGEGEQVPRSSTHSLPEEQESTRTSSPTPLDNIPQSIPTPKPETTSQETDTPEVKVSSPLLKPSRPPSGVDGGSTTPPGSPEKQLPASQTTLLNPASPIPVLTTPPFGLGLGRPSSRPIRSSPLASAPIMSADDDESGPETSPSKSASPTIGSKPFGQPPPPVTSTAPPPVISGEGFLVSKPRRPKTPPLLGTATSAPSAMPQVSDGPVALGQSRVIPMGSKTSPGPLVQPQVAPPVPSSTSLPRVDEEEEISQHPMQAEFLRAYREMTKELVQLYKRAQEMAVIRPVISEPRGLEKLVQNNQAFVPGQYSHGDLKAFATIVGILQKKVVPLLELGNENKRSLRDLQNLVLISETKQEEVVRWVHARQDPDFANTLKPRTLGPEHSENQIRLRKAVQVARDRIQRCEDEIESLKKRLEQHKSGKVGFRPPSLDTIDRTCRNIQLALEERTKLLQQLHDRIETSSPKTSQRLQTSQAHTRSPVSNPSSVTPPFASVAAAALNSERSSLRLKIALLSAREEPLLTTKVTKLEATGINSVSSFQPQRPDWKLPPVPPLDSEILPTSRRAGRIGKRHGAVQLKEVSPESSAKTVAFDWGPLPGAVPMESLSADVRNPRVRSSPGPLKQETRPNSEWDEEA